MINSGQGWEAVPCVRAGRRLLPTAAMLRPQSQLPRRVPPGFGQESQV